MSEPVKQFSRWTIAATATAVLGNIVAPLIPVRTLLQLAPGDWDDRVLWGDNLLAFLVAVATFVIVIPLAIAGIRKDRRRSIAVIAICLAFTPWFFSWWVAELVMKMRGITLD